MKFEVTLVVDTDYVFKPEEWVLDLAYDITQDHGCEVKEIKTAEGKEINYQEYLEELEEA